MKQGSLLRNVSYTMISNGLSLAISTLMVFILPKFMGIHEYGAWQLFLFYTSYLGFFHLGWQDGMYLRNAGMALNGLDKDIFSGQVLLNVVLQFLFVVILGGVAYITVAPIDGLRYMIILMALSVMIPLNMNNLFSLILQATNHIRRFAFSVIASKITLGLGVIGLIIWPVEPLHWLYYFFLGSLCISLGITIHRFRRLLVWPNWSKAHALEESRTNLIAGSKLMFANIAGMLIVGIIRYGISLGWDLGTFGKVSLVLGVSNFILLFISAVSIAIFPIIKRIDQEKMGYTYYQVRLFLSIALMGLCISYFPIQAILSLWLPHFKDALVFMPILFPLCLYESKVQILTNTYLKSLRKEGLMLVVNVSVVIISLILTYVSVWMLHDLKTALFSILLVYAIRSIVSEYVVSRYINISIFKAMIGENLYVVAFILASIHLSLPIALVVMMVIYGAIAYMKRHSLKESIYYLRHM